MVMREDIPYRVTCVSRLAFPGLLLAPGILTCRVDTERGRRVGSCVEEAGAVRC